MVGEDKRLTDQNHTIYRGIYNGVLELTRQRGFWPAVGLIGVTFIVSNSIVYKIGEHQREDLERRNRPVGVEIFTIGKEAKVADVITADGERYSLPLTVEGDREGVGEEYRTFKQAVEMGRIEAQKRKADLENNIK